MSHSLSCRTAVVALMAGLSINPLAHAQPADPAAPAAPLTPPSEVKPVSLGNDAIDLENADKLKGVALDEVLAELERREGTSGIAEKASRSE